MVAYALLVGSATVLAITIAALVMYRVELVKQAKKLVCQSFLETLKKSIVIGTMDVELPAMGVTQIGDSNESKLHCTFVVHDIAVIFRILLHHDIGFGSAYCDGLWSTDNLTTLVAILAANREGGTFNSDGSTLSKVSQTVLYLWHLAKANTIAQSQVNIEKHYDLGNAMYTTFLDKTMTYSSAYFKDGLDLGQAQIAKYDRIISEANIGSQDRVVEIGCGWGGFAIRAAQTTGCHVVGVTLSHEQLAFAKAKVTELGLDDKITFLLLDYRLVAERYKGQFDHVVSIEMIEAVGVEYLPTYFAALHALVKPSGSVMIQAISVVEAKYKVYCKSTDFIQQYIFPGGHCPSLAAIASAAADVGLTIHGVEEFGLHYAETLRQWDKKFMASRARLLELGYDERFIRMWHYYFCYCEAGFAARLLSLYQIRLTKHYAIDRLDAHVANPIYGIKRREPVPKAHVGDVQSACPATR